MVHVTRHLKRAKRVERSPASAKAARTDTPHSAFSGRCVRSRARFRRVERADPFQNALQGLCPRATLAENPSFCVRRHFGVGARAAGDGAFFNAARLTASSLLFAATPPYPGALPAPGTSLTSSISVGLSASKCPPGISHLAPSPNRS